MKAAGERAWIGACALALILSATWLVGGFLRAPEEANGLLPSFPSTGSTGPGQPNASLDAATRRAVESPPDDEPTSEQTLEPEAEALDRRGARAAHGEVWVRVEWSADAAPAEGIAICLRSLRRGSYRRTLATDALGWAEFERVPAGPTRMTVDRGSMSELVVVAGERLEEIVRLGGGPAAAGLQGIVLDEHENGFAGASIWLSAETDPVTGAEAFEQAASLRALEFSPTLGQEVEGVGLVRSPPGLASLGGEVVATSAQDGSFTLRGVPRGRLIGARASKHVPSALAWVSGTPRERIVLRLGGPGLDCRGRVVDEDGAAVAEATVLVRNTSGEPWRRAPDRRLIPPPRPICCTTDSQGRWSAEGFAAGKVLVTVLASGYCEATHTTSLVANRNTEIVTVVQRGIEVFGRVTTEDGSAVVGARVEAFDRHSEFVTTDGDGGYRLEGVHPAAVTVWVESDTHGSAELSRTGVEESIEWNPVLSRGAVILGRVTLPDGTPLAGLSVHVIPVEERGYARGRGHWLLDRGRLVTDEHGRFELTRCYDGEFEIVVTQATGAGGLVDRSPGLRSIRCAHLDDVVASSTEIEIVVAPVDLWVTQLAVTVSTAGGDPVPDASLTLIQESGNSHFGKHTRYRPRTKTDAQGNGRWNNVLLRGYRMSVSADGFASEEVEIDLRSTLPPPAVTVLEEVLLRRE
ncbi:MAG: hypothetical protein GY711_13580 [bacterium]|nr:hypothetical protein [bacterium]